MTAQSTASATAAGTANSPANRTRPVRNGASTSISARAAARKPASTDDGEDDGKMELQARLDELQERLQQSELACSEAQKHAEVLQIKLDEALKEQSLLEDSVHEHTERVEELENEKKESVRARRELEQIYEVERVQAMKEKEGLEAREEDLQGAMQRMKESLAQREMRASLGGEDERRPSVSRTSSLRSDRSPNPETHAAEGGRSFAPSSSLQRSDSRNNSRLIMQKDKVIEGLRLEIAEAQIKLVELENLGGGHLQQMEKDAYELRMQNARLMEENESFQLLITEKTLNGDFVASDLLRVPSANDSRPGSRTNSTKHGRASLADELAGQDDMSSTAEILDTATVAEGGTGEASLKERRLQTDLNNAKDQNKALTLYINNIISRLLQHEQFEQILDQTPDLMAGPGAISKKFAAQRDPDGEKELPPPPPPKDDQDQAGPQSLLQRAGSVLRGRGTKPARPTSVIGPAASEPRPEEPAATVHSNPSTAPSIPLNRTTSTTTRGSSGHRRANSDWPASAASSVVTNMYRGPSPALQGPASPGLSSPTSSRNSFFALGAGSRLPSSSTVPTIAESEGKENDVPATSTQGIHRDSKGHSDASRSNRDSVASQPGGAAAPSATASGSGPFADFSNLPPTASNPSSPPRSTTSSGERPAPNVPAVMMGSKPRPLRLVQEAQDSDEKARKAQNRGSWFGWMNNAGGVGPAGMPAWMQGRSGSDSGPSQ